MRSIESEPTPFHGAAAVEIAAQAAPGLPDRLLVRHRTLHMQKVVVSVKGIALLDLGPAEKFHAVTQRISRGSAQQAPANLLPWLVLQAAARRPSAI